jgi:hypothetical protein
VGGPAPAALLVLLLLLPKVLRASCSPEPTVAAGDPSTAISLLMLLAVVEGRADNSTSLPALRPVLCLPGPLGGLDPSPEELFCALFEPGVSDSPPHDRQRRAFCMKVRYMLLVQAEVMEAVLLLFLQRLKAGYPAVKTH